ncbi:MAG: DUF3465 domain-containing protein [Gammaproteobacteria bacterium]|nr:DUF3465 domain-containing protein [Gammaproteobacteria bacterium]
MERLDLRRIIALGLVLVGLLGSPLAALARGDFAIGQAWAEQVLAEAFKNRQSNILIQGHGVVEKLLKDDNDGHRHQRFILRLASGQTLLVAHNIELAPRIEDLAVGDRVDFLGEYEWNPKGGLIHWTHRDPAGKHPAGWLRHQGRIYQ